MDPRVEAACDFVEGSGRRATIDRLADAGGLGRNVTRQQEQFPYRELFRNVIVVL